MTNKDVNQFAHDINPNNLIQNLNPLTQIAYILKAALAIILVGIVLIFYLVATFKRSENACSLPQKIARQC